MEGKDDEKTPAPTPDTLTESPSSSRDKWGTRKETGAEHDDVARPQRPLSSHSTLADEPDNANDGSEALRRIDTPKRDLVRVPASERRGLFARFALVAEVTEPTDYSNKTKWFLTFVVAFAAAAAPVGSGIIFRAYLLCLCRSYSKDSPASLHQVAIDLHASETLTNLNVALFMLSMAIFPLWWSAFSETLGRRTIYLISFTLFVLFAVLSAVSKSIGMLIAFRMLSGGASASVQAVGAGTIADLWEPRERGKAMGYFYLGPLCGPLLSPIVGGALAQRWNWRASLYGLAIYGCKF